MRVISKKLMKWLMGLNLWMRYIVIAVLFHLGILAFIGTRKIVAYIPKIVASFEATTLPGQILDEPDPFALPRDYDYTGPVLGEGGGAGDRKGAGGMTSAGGAQAHILTEQARDATPASLAEVIGVISDSATEIARPLGGPSTLPMAGIGIGGSGMGTSGIKGPGGGIYGARLGPGQRAVALEKYAGTQQAEQAVLKALRWLKTRQRKDGSWPCEQSDPAGSALAVMAFLGHGETVDSEEFGTTVQKGLDYLVKRVGENGLVTDVSHPHTAHGYSQALVTLALSEAYGMMQSPVLREPLELAIGAIVRWQSSIKNNPLHTGGWRYTPVSNDSDLSVTGWMVMALKSARGSGIVIPQETFDGAATFVWNMQGKPGFGYQDPQNWPNMTAIGVLSQQFLGNGRDPRVIAALDSLLEQKANWQTTKFTYVLYTWYYMTLAMFQGGGHYWSHWNREIRDLMVKSQEEDGRWLLPLQSELEPKHVGHSPVYSTSLGALILEVYYRYLPIYQLPDWQTENDPSSADDAK